MGSGTKTDNSVLGPKLELRRYFLRKYHAGTIPQVFDACEGQGVLWTRLRSEFAVRYFGVDLKPRPGHLKMDSRRLLQLPGWKLDVVDIDTYGSPWTHWEGVVRNVPAPVTVFLTVGTLSFAGSVDRAALRALGLGEPLAGMIPVSFSRKLSALALDYSLAMCYLHKRQVVECLVTSRPANLGAGLVQYLGLRLAPA